jgi:molybdopterin-guanine dinucleotide biosynthesis protein A
MLDHVLARLAPQVNQVILSANGNERNLAGYGLPIVADGGHAGRGPLAGILAALRWTGARLNADSIVVSVPADTPFIPPDLAQRLADAAAKTAGIAIAGSNGRSHHAVAAWPLHMVEAIEDQLARGDNFAVQALLRACGTVTVEFPAPAYDPFLNVNTPVDLGAARKIALITTGTARPEEDVSRRFARR